MTHRRRRGAVSIVLLAVTAACGGGSPGTASTGSLDSAPATGAATTMPVATAASSTTDMTTAPNPTTVAPVSDPSRPATTATNTSGTTITTTAPVAPAVDLAACAAAIPLRERIALLVWPGVYSQDWDTSLRTVEEHQVGGVILMEASAWTPDSVTGRLARLDDVVERGVVVATDEEGGIVQRLALLGPLPSQQEMSESQSIGDARQLITVHGERVATAGVDMALGPVVDVVPASGEVPLTRSRFFTGAAAEVADFGRAYVEGWQANGVIPVVKHYPGHGGASGDTHDEPGVTPSLADLERSDLVPFRALADTGTAVMVGHLTVPGLTDGLPATQSERAVRYLRDDLGYADALVLSDALGMQAVGLPEDVAAVQSLVAGIDVVLFTATGQTGPVIDAIERAVADGTLTDERITLSASRVLRYLDEDRRGCG